MNPLFLIRDKVEQLWLKRWYLAPRLKGTKLDLQLDLSTPGKGVRAVAELSFRPQVDSKHMVCGLGDAKVAGATWEGLVIDPDTGDLYTLYGDSTKVEDVLVKRAKKAPAIAKPYTDALNAAAK